MKREGKHVPLSPFKRVKKSCLAAFECENIMRPRAKINDDGEATVVFSYEELNKAKTN